MRISDQELQQLEKAELANIVKKIKAGKTLTVAERNLLSKASGKNQESGVAKSFVELATVLGVSRRALNKWSKQFEDAPKANPNGSHDVAAWREFMHLHGLRGKSDENSPDKYSLECRKLLGQAERIEFENAVKRGEYIPKSEAKSETVQMIQNTKSVLREKFENELPAQLAGLSPVECQQRCKAAIDEVCSHLHNALC